MSRPTHRLAAPVVNAVVLRVTERLETLLWRRSRAPAKDCWSLPGGFVRQGESLEGAMRRHLAEKVGVTDVGHLEQLDSHSADTHPELWLLDVSYLALIPRGAEPHLPPDTEWHPVDALPSVAFGHAGAVHRAHDRLRGKLSYSNVAHALAPDRFGNVTLNARHDEITASGLRLGHGVVVDIEGEEHDAHYARTFADVEAGELLLYEDAYRTLALAVNRGSAAERLAVRLDDELRIRPA